jgi:Ser/Thr protein kinase RdoA (MazF antagonist)
MISDLIDRSAELYGISAAQLKPLSGGHFSQVYAFTRGGREYVLRVSPPDEDLDLPAMQSILDWMRFLSANGGSIAGPLPSLRGRMAEELKEDEESFIVTAFEKARGILAELLPIEQWDEALFQSLGKTTGKMHAIAKKYTPPAGLTRRPEWDQVENCYHHDVLLSGKPLIQLKRDQALQAVQVLPKGPEAYGLIHGDLHCANFIVDVGDHQITLFDFDDCCYGWFAMDVAMSVFDLLVLYNGSDRARFAERFLESYLQGYLPENHLDASWFGRLPLFLKLLEVEIYAELAGDYEITGAVSLGPAASWSGRFMAGRAQRIEHELPYVDIDFEGIYRQIIQREAYRPPPVA